MIDKQALIEQCKTMIDHIDKLEKLDTPMADGFRKNREIARIALAALTAKPAINIQFRNGWPVLCTTGVISENLPITDGFHDFYAAPPAPLPTIPDGWKLVPIEPTQEMLEAAPSLIMADEWIKCSDRMPLEPGNFQMIDVLVSDGEEVRSRSCLCGDIPKPWVSFTEYGEIPVDKITHWMPMPKPPLNKDKKE